MGYNIENDKLIAAITNTARKIKDIRDKYHNIRKGSKQNFNFFAGLVNGKETKTHIEKYHSNFIAYLLNPSESHDCDFLFLNAFLKIIKNKIPNQENFNNEFLNSNELRTVLVERERNANGRFIDITIELNSKEWIVFIENKIRHAEGNDQVKDYYNFAKGIAKKGAIGIYLTPNGDSPPSVEKEEDVKNKIILLNYKDIISWLEDCCTNKELIRYSHIISSLNQYIDVIKDELKIMEDQEMKDFKEYLKENKKDVVLILQNKEYLDSSLQEFVKEQKMKFIASIKDWLIKNSSENKEITFTEGNGSEKSEHFEKSLLFNYNKLPYTIILQLEGNKMLWFIIDKDNKAVSHKSFNHNGYLDGITVKEDDYIYPEKNAIVLIEAMDDEEKRKSLFNDASKTILDKIKQVL